MAYKRELIDLILNGYIKQANRLLNDPNYNVNDLGAGDQPLAACAFHAKDSRDERGNYVGNEYVQMMRRILEHTTFPRGDDPLATAANACSEAMLWVCDKVKSVTAAKLLLSKDNLDLGLRTIKGTPMMHKLMEQLDSFNIEISTDIFRELLKYPHIGDFIYNLDDYGLSLLDRFMINKNVHCYDLDSTVNAKRLLEMLLSVKGLSTVSGKTLALAGTLCSPAVFKMLVDHGANSNDSLEGESTAHCIIARNSLLKCSYLLKSDVDLSHKWNDMTPIELARAYGCKKEILELLGDEAKKKHAVFVKTPHPGDLSNCSCNSKMGHDFHLCEWAKFKACISTKIPVNCEQSGHTGIRSRNALFAVKYNQHFMSIYSSEIIEMKHAIETLFSQISEKFSRSSTHSHLAFEYRLRGSMNDRCKCFGPNEFDFALKLSEFDYFNTQTTIKPSDESEWKRLCQSDGSLLPVSAAQEFYNAFAVECQEYNARNQDKTTGIVRTRFQFMSKISRIKLLWMGDDFAHLNVHVDIVLVFSCYPTENMLPFGLKCSSRNWIAKKDRHSYDNDCNFQGSYCSAEANIMKALPEPIRQGFITAKASRQHGVCAPGLDMTQLGIVEDLAIEDYITSHSLKNCLLNVLKRVNVTKQRKPVFFWDADWIADSLETHVKMITDTYCKYAIASSIIEEFKCSVVNKKMPTWYPWHPLINCTDNTKCGGNENICCRKREIKLALLQNMSTWLKDVENLRYLHDGDTCNCADKYSKAQLDYHNAFISRLVQTGKIDFEHGN